MTKTHKDPIKDKEEIIINVCEVCHTKYSLEEAKEREMACCGQPLKQESKRVSIPLGP